MVVQGHNHFILSLTAWQITKYVSDSLEASRRVRLSGKGIISPYANYGFIPRIKIHSKNQVVLRQILVS